MSITLTHPLPGHAQTGYFGNRPEFIENGIKIPAMFHNGADFGAPGGTRIRAAHNGRVAWSGWDPVGGGWGVMITHDDSWSTLYFHMQARSTDVVIGQRVTTGQTIGRVGATGSATGNHLHFMLRVKGSDIDPMRYMQATPKPSPSKPSSGQEEEEFMLEPLYITDNKKTNPFWALHPLTGKRRQIRSAEWAAIVAKAKSEGREPVLTQVSTSALKAIPTA